MKFEIGQTVYHVASGEMGVVTDIRKFYRYNIIQYLVACGINNEGWCAENELSDEKPIF